MPVNDFQKQGGIGKEIDTEKGIERNDKNETISNTPAARAQTHRYNNRSQVKIDSMALMDCVMTMWENDLEMLDFFCDTTRKQKRLGNNAVDKLDALKTSKRKQKHKNTKRQAS
jgi:hypothetical protein